VSNLANVGRREYSLTAFTKGMYFLFGVASLVFGLSVFYAMSMVSARQGSFLILFVAPILLGIYLVALAARSKLIIDGTRVEVHYAFRERSAELSEIEGFRTISSRNGSYWILRLKGNLGKITISKSFNEDDDLREWLQHLTDLDERDRGALLEKIQHDQELGATPKDRLTALKQARLWNIVLSGAAIAAAIGLFLGDQSLRVLFAAVLALVPAVLLYLVAKQDLLYALFKPKKDPRTDVGIGLMVSGFGLLLVNQGSHFVSMLPLLPYIVLIVLVCLVSLAGTIRGNPQFWGSMIGVVFFCGLYGFGLVACWDKMLDKSKPETFAVSVTGKHISSGSRSTTYSLELEPWGPEDSKNNLDVSRGVYESIETGDSVFLELRTGALHAAWYRLVSWK
jgi:hypothetical protein